MPQPMTALKDTRQKIPAQGLRQAQTDRALVILSLSKYVQ